jgi:hypothetical protein
MSAFNTISNTRPRSQPMVHSCAIAQCQYYIVWRCNSWALKPRCSTLLAGATSPVNFIRDDREAASGRAVSCHIYLSWRLHTLLTFHRCTARVFYDLLFRHGEQFAKILCPSYLVRDADVELSGLRRIGVRDWAAH